MLNPELQEYILRYGQRLMTDPELRALRRITLTPHGDETTRKMAQANPIWEQKFGFADQATNKLLAENNADSLRKLIAERIWRTGDQSIFNHCPKCGLLARTPDARQCRHCGHDWH